MRIVIALGGNALITRGGPTDIAAQSHNVVRAARSIAALATDNEVIVTHGNGPQIGLLALQASVLPGGEINPLDILGAQTDGMIGYLLQRELMNALGHTHVITLLTQTEVDRTDPAFARPTKFIGPVYAEQEARRLAALAAWTIARDGPYWRRVVPSPEPLSIPEAPAVEHLLRARHVVVCAGGGGIPVTRSSSGVFEGADCVIDKDLTSSLLASTLRADCLLMLTDVDAVYGDWGTPAARALRAAHPQALTRLPFPAGSMGPKVEAARRFAVTGERRAYIGSLEDATGILTGRSGTLIANQVEGLVWRSHSAAAGQ
jgi:carbamate kinase